MKFLTLLFLSLSIVAHAEDARTSFAKTFSAGQRSWKINNVTAKVTTDGRVTLYNCQSKEPLSIQGEFPNVTFKFMGLECGKDIPDVIRLLQFIAYEWVFESHFIPAETEPNQFRLRLVSRGPFNFPELTEFKSANALTRENLALFDLIATEKNSMLAFGPTYHYLEFALQRGLEGKPDELRLYYQKKDFAISRFTSEATVELTAPWSPLNSVQRAELSKW